MTLVGPQIGGFYAAGGGAYAQKTFDPGANGLLTGSMGSSDYIMFGAYVSRPTDHGGSPNNNIDTLFQIGAVTSVRMYPDGSWDFFVATFNGSTIVVLSGPAGSVAASGLTFIGGSYDHISGDTVVRYGATKVTGNTSDGGSNVGAGDLYLFERSAGGRAYRNPFADIVIQTDGTLTVDDLYNSGTPTDPSGLTAEVILGGTMTAANFNAATQLGTVTLSIATGDNTFTEV